jgi:hypothetical protein
MGMHAVHRSVARGLAVLAGTLAAVAGAQQPGELTGIYAKRGSELAILQGDNESLVYYEATFPQGQSVGTCGCTLVLQQKPSPSQWALLGPEPDEAWVLRIEPKKLVVGTQQVASCCGAGWPGADSFSRAGVKPPQSCKVKAPRAHFHAADEGHTQRKAFVVAGDMVDVYLPPEEPNLVPARFKGSKKSTVGLLKREELDCTSQGATPGTQAAVNTQALTGTWTQVERVGKGYIIRESCEGGIPHFKLQPNGDWEMSYGQEDELIKVTALQPGSTAGAYTLELTHTGGTKQKVEWTVVDAKQGLVRLKGTGTSYFRSGTLFVRDAQKAGIPIQRDTCDEEEEQ